MEKAVWPPELPKNTHMGFMEKKLKSVQNPQNSLAHREKCYFRNGYRITPNTF